VLNPYFFPARAAASKQHPDSRTHRHANTPTQAPAAGATRYIQTCCKWPEINAGANDRAGFIDAPQIGPANIASRPMTAAIALRVHLRNLKARHEFENRSFPASLAACPRGFALYLAGPIRSVHELTRIGAQIPKPIRDNSCNSCLTSQPGKFGSSN
jgi:hypothetical protein